MKKVIYFAALLLLTVFASCEKDEMGGTATESVAGQWYVKANEIRGGQVVENPNAERFLILTYNTSANNPNEIWIDDLGHFKKIKIKASADVNGLTFSASQAQNQSGNNTVNVTNGKITPNGGKQNNGSPADYITMDVELSSESGVIYRLEGVRYSGLAEND